MASRKTIFSVGLEDMFPPEKQDMMWSNLEEGLSQLFALTGGKGHSEKWLLFSTERGPAYADCVLCSVFVWSKCAGHEGG